VRRLEPRRKRRAVQRRAELAEVLVALGDLPEEEIAVGTHAGERVGAQPIHPSGPVLDHLGERVLAGCALVDRQAPPGGIDPVERIRDVLAAHAAECYRRFFCWSLRRRHADCVAEAGLAPAPRMSARPLSSGVASDASGMGWASVSPSASALAWGRSASRSARPGLRS